MDNLFGPEFGPLPLDLFLIWLERSNIKEFDGGLPRKLAEAQALREVWDLGGKSLK